MSIVFVIDTGSSSMRGILFDENGKICFASQQTYTMQTCGNYIATYAPEDFESCLKAICYQCASWAREQKVQIEALSFTGQRSSIMPVDHHGKPLDSFMTWYDKRAADICNEINLSYGDTIQRLAGMQSTPVLSGPKIAWLHRHKPEIYAKAYKIIGIQDYLLFLCTGEMVTDVTFASRTNLMDIQSLRWSDSLLEIYGCDRNKLVSLVPACTIVGKITQVFSSASTLPVGIPVITAGGDQQCSVLGQGIVQPGTIGVTCGSGAYLATVVDVAVPDVQRRVNLCASICPNQWILEASTLSSGTVQDWFLRSFYPSMDANAAMRELHKELENSCLGANGVIMLPDLAGKGCPDWNSFAKGAFLNIGFSTARNDFARAMLEGICAEIAESYQVLTEFIIHPQAVNITGGLTRFDLMNQIVADMIDFPVTRCDNGETTAIGAFLAAGFALGRYASLAQSCASIFSGNTKSKVYHPASQNASVYQLINQARRQLYEAIPHEQLQELLAKINVQQGAAK